MDSDGSEVSRIRQFGLYRNVDSRAEQFMRLSKRRQMTQGCVCATVTTIITVTIVIIILLIYEYAIVVESDSVQKKIKIISGHDRPVADKLDRTFFGFDQETYERMPLLVNAMQENSYVDPTQESPLQSQKVTKLTTLFNHQHVKPIRRTSPRPFIFEYRSPTPKPFNVNYNNYNTGSWLENYRSIQRMKNLESLIKYLEKTINAKFGDLYAMPSNSEGMAFSGVYVQPTDDTQETTTTSTTEATSIANSPKDLQSDRLFKFKPQNPGDVNLLADEFLRFSPRFESKSSPVPIFRPIPNLKNTCVGIKCGTPENSLDKKIFEVLHGSSEIDPSQKIEKPKSFSLMLNLFPIQQKRQDVLTNTYDKIYLTTKRPRLFFQQKSSIRKVARKPNYIIREKVHGSEKHIDHGLRKLSSTVTKETTETPLILHFNVYPKKNNVHPQHTQNVMRHFKSNYTQPATHTGLVNSNSIPPTTTEYVKEIELQPISTQSSPTLHPLLSTLLSAETGNNNYVQWSTNPPEILKFSHEDARVSIEYRNMLETDDGVSDTSTVSEEMDDIRRHEKGALDDDDIQSLIFKLKNRVTNYTEIDTSESTTTSTSEPTTEESTTFKTYVPQINGHYRSLNQNSRNINDWLDKNPARKRRLEVRKNIYKRPAYVEIDRRHSVESSNRK